MSRPSENPSIVKLRLAPITLAVANDYVNRVHRHHKSVTGHRFSVSVVDELGQIRGVAIAGRPVARRLDDGATLEITRVATDGAPNACSMLYCALARAAVSLGYRRHRVFTYILETESGASLRAAGWVRSEGVVTPGQSWSVPSRPRADKHPLGPKIRYQAGTEPRNGDT